MNVEPLTSEQIAAMLPDQLRTYLATLEQAFTIAAADLSEALGEEFAARSKTARLRNDVASFKVRIGVVQSHLKSLKEGF